MPFGNTRETTLEEIWYSNYTQAFKTLPVEATECNGCGIKQYCGGGCRMIAWQLHKSLLAKDDNSCPLYQFFCRRIQPLFEEYGIEAVQLPDSPEYAYDPTLLTIK
jgi:sulfatase maturation enzyme AslB (radical SAM superfamily)